MSCVGVSLLFGTGVSMAMSQSSKHLSRPASVVNMAPWSKFRSFFISYGKQLCTNSSLRWDCQSSSKLTSFGGLLECSRNCRFSSWSYEMVSRQLSASRSSSLMRMACCSTSASSSLILSSFFRTRESHTKGTLGSSSGSVFWVVSNLSKNILGCHSSQILMSSSLSGPWKNPLGSILLRVRQLSSTLLTMYSLLASGDSCRQSLSSRTITCPLIRFSWRQYLRSCNTCRLSSMNFFLTSSSRMLFRQQNYSNYSGLSSPKCAWMLSIMRCRYSPTRRYSITIKQLRRSLKHSIDRLSPYNARRTPSRYGQGSMLRSTLLWLVPYSSQKNSDSIERKAICSLYSPAVERTSRSWQGSTGKYWRSLALLMVASSIFIANAVRTRKSPQRPLNKSMSNPNLKRNQSRDQLRRKEPKEKAAAEHTRLRKRIEMLDSFDILLKLHYKGKKLSVPISNVGDRSLRALVDPNIVRFEKEILKNPQFDPHDIENWRTVGKVDHLRDYYFQLDKPMSVFRSQTIEIEPIWRVRETRMVQLRDFEIVKCIGTGGFSKVFLVRKKNSGKYYALKLMEKAGLLGSGKECVVTNQRDIMVGLNNPYVLRMDYAFETPNFVAFALEYCPGGQLFYYLRKIKRMTEEEARYCFIEILVGFRYLHNKNIIYRDIKPENIIIDHDGHLKIADFGLSKEQPPDQASTYTYCGSPQYMAPEMLDKSGHSFSVDFYCLGALLYQLVTGNPPFYSRDVQKIYYSIQYQEIDFPSQIELSPQIKMLLSGLLVKEPKRRLGSMGGIREILAHPWVRKLKVADVVEKKIPTPIKIDLLQYNINEEEIGDPEELFEIKLRQEEAETRPFEPMFEDFYFAREQSARDVLFNDLTIPQIRDRDVTTTINKENTINKDNTYHSSKINRQESTAHKPRKLKKTKSKAKMNNNDLILVERARKRPEKSLKKDPKEQKKRVMSPLQRVESKGLKRIKSSGALRDFFK